MSKKEEKDFEVSLFGVILIILLAGVAGFFLTRVLDWYFTSVA